MDLLEIVVTYLKDTQKLYSIVNICSITRINEKCLFVMLILAVNFWASN